MESSKAVLKRFGANLRKERLKRDLSQEALASRAKISRNFIGMVERGERNMTITKVDSVAQAMGMNRWDLMRF
ncbi:MAG: helix-turn-helix domain-containing protein [Bacteroidetes bacterium]|nr:helix-turn-helix domain-containing protein [Gammaproteobacteria bacterium]MBU1820921.1 helix-turn-helix domain-containing protein [Bacteroidota bacterium]